jgi:hypothetical protein
VAARHETEDDTDLNGKRCRYKNIVWLITDEIGNNFATIHVEAFCRKASLHGFGREVA